MKNRNSYWKKWTSGILERGEVKYFFSNIPWKWATCQPELRGARAQLRTRVATHDGQSICERRRLPPGPFLFCWKAEGLLKSPQLRFNSLLHFLLQGGSNSGLCALHRIHYALILGRLRLRLRLSHPRYLHAPLQPTLNQFREETFHFI